MDKVLQNSLLARGFSDAELNDLLTVANEQTFYKNQLIFKENDPADSLFILISGKVFIERQLSHPNIPISTQVMTVKKGQIFGEMGLVEDVTRTATARAASQIRTIVLEYQALRTLFESDNKLGYRFMNNLAVILGTRLRNMNKQWNNSNIRTHNSFEFEYYG